MKFSTWNITYTWKLYDNATEREKNFRTLSEIVKFYNYALQIPLQSKLIYEPYFQGDIAVEDATEMLQTQFNGCFLIRYSPSGLGYLAASVKNNNNGIDHFPIKQSNGQLVVQTEEKQYKFDNIDQLVDQFNKLNKFTVPCVNPVSQVVRIIENWKMEISK